MKHKYLKHENCRVVNCNICDGGLALCTKCGCGEGELATDCPEHKLHPITKQLIYDGVLDYKNKTWTRIHKL